jgi:hypothetical protein
VHDGDTVHLVDGRKLRLIGINTPEVARDGKPAEAFAVNARNRLRERLSAHDNRVGLVLGSETEDHYGRTLAHLFTPDDGNLQADLLQQGLAFAVAFPPNTRYADCYQRAESIARCASSGLWSGLQYTLADSSRGFHVVKARVERIEHTGKGVFLYLEGGIQIGIRNANLKAFDRAALNALEGREIFVRGWVNPRKPTADNGYVRHYIRVRHPASIETGYVCSTD